MSYSSGFEIEVGSVLRRNDPNWEEVPGYGVFDKSQLFGRFAALEQAVSQVTGNRDYMGITEARELSEAFVNRAFGVFEGRIKPPKGTDWVFMVPARTTRRQDNGYASEITPFLPVLDPKYGIGSNDRQRSIVGLPPIVLDEYEGNGGKRGALVYTPVYPDMLGDYSSLSEGLQVAQVNIQATAMFANQVLGARFAGLGAVLPGLTRFGRSIDQSVLKTTTGHGGTAWLVGETVRKLADENLIKGGRLGVIGAAGSIGQASVSYILGADGLDFETVNLYDKNTQKLSGIVGQVWPDINAHKLAGVEDILIQSDLIVSAITEQIDLDLIDPHGELDLSGKVLVDDSQPGCFDRSQVESRGGKLVWVVGDDNSGKGAVTRVGGYNYGSAAGLFEPTNLWGCEAEVAALALTNSVELGVKEPISYERAVEIGQKCASVGIRAAGFQAFGRPVVF